MGAMERDGKTPKGHELRVLPGENLEEELKAMVKTLRVEDGDILLVRLEPDTTYRNQRLIHDTFERVFQHLGVLGVALVAPAGFDIERIESDRVPDLIRLLQGLQERVQAKQTASAQELEKDDGDEEEDDRAEKAKPSVPDLRGVDAKGSRKINEISRDRERSGGGRRSRSVARG